MTISKIFRFGLGFTALSVLLLTQPRDIHAFGGLTGALEDVTNQINNNDSSNNNNSNNNSNTSAPPTTTQIGNTAQPNYAQPAPAPAPVAPTNANDGVTTTDPATGISTNTKTHFDGSKTVTKKDKNGNLISEEIIGKDGKVQATKTRDPLTGNITAKVFNKDGSTSILETNKEGFLVSERTEQPERPSASMFDPESGVTTKSVKNADGSRTVTKKDRDGKVISTENIPPPGKGTASASIYDPKTGVTTEAKLNSDGSRTVTKTDKSGGVTQETVPPPGKGEASASSYDANTGLTTTSRREPDGSHTVSQSRNWKDDKGVEHTLSTDNRGGQAEVVRNKDGSTVTTEWDAKNNKTETTQLKDGGRRVVSENADGHIQESTTRPDGTSQVVTKDHSGNVLSTTDKTKDGKTVTVDELGTKTEMIPGKDGRMSMVQTDKEGNKTLTRMDADGNIVEQREQLVKPKEPGERYFENELGGRPGEWDTLPKSTKAQYAGSEAQIQESMAQELLRQHQAEEKARVDEETKQFSENLQRETDRKLEAIQREYEEGKAKRAEEARKEEIFKKRREAVETIDDYDRRIYEAQARGDRDEAQRLMIEADEFSTRSNDLFEMTPEEMAHAEHMQTVRDRVTGKVTNAARNIAENELQFTNELQDMKEGVTGKAKYLSIGAEMQEQTKESTRAADRQLAYANAKNAEIYRLLDDPKTTAEEKQVLYDMLNMADLQADGAATQLSDNAMLTAAGYGIDVAMTVSGGKLVTLAERGVEGAAARLLAKETAAAVVKKTTQTGIVTLAGEGATKVATGAARRAVGEEAAKTVERVLTTDVGEAAGSAAERAATRVVGEKAVEATKNAASKVADVATTDVRDIPGHLRDAVKGTAETAETRASTAAAPKPIEAPKPVETPRPTQSKKNLEDTWADDAIEPTEVPNGKTASGEAAHGNRTMPIEELESYAKNPRVRTQSRPQATENFPQKTIDPQYRRPDFTNARSSWKKVPPAERQAFDQGVRDAVDEAAAMGDKWAKRLQADLNNGKIKYEYEPGLDAEGLAPGDGTVLLNPMRNGKALQNPDRVASGLIHEYAHSYKGPTKWAAQEGRTVTGSATKGEYNEVRAFSAEANFNKNLRNARELNGKSFDESSVRELDALMDVNSLPNTGPSMERGLQARKNLQEGLVDDYSYGRDYQNSRALGTERLSTYRGGSMTDIRKRLDGLRGPNGESTPEYEKLLAEIQAEGGRTRPINAPPLAGPPPASPKPLPSTPKPLPAKAESKPVSEMTPQERQTFHDEKAAKEAGENFRNGKDPDIEDDVLLPEGGEVHLPKPPGSYSANLNQKQIDELFQGGVGRVLTPEQVLQKADLIRTGRAPQASSQLMGGGAGQKIFPQDPPVINGNFSDAGTRIDKKPE